MAEAEAVPDAPSQEEPRWVVVDLRQEVNFTIDGADAKDLMMRFISNVCQMVTLELVFILLMCLTHVTEGICT